MVDPGTGALVQGYLYKATQTDPADKAAFNAAGSMGNVQFLLGGQEPSDTDPLATGKLATAGNMALTSYSIDQNGVVTGVYNNGTTSETKKLRKLPLLNLPMIRAWRILARAFIKIPIIPVKPMFTLQDKRDEALSFLVPLKCPMLTFLKNLRI